MPLLSSSSYRPHLLHFNGHMETILPSMFRKVEGVTYQRERLELADGDFIDLDWLNAGSSHLVIISHGLEGSSERHYAKGMARFFSKMGWDALAWNCRSCSGEMNRLPRLYHHADTEDLASVIDHVKHSYQTITLVGFSMGGSLSLKYLGEVRTRPENLRSCAVFSVPCDLGSSARGLDKPQLAFYRKRFLRKLSKKMLLKSQQFPEKVTFEGFEQIRYFEEFDDRYTAPLHGFAGASDFYEKGSAINYLAGIEIPTLLVNAANDPMLPEACYPKELVQELSNVFLEIPARGGHVGFPLRRQEENWMEQRAWEFCNPLAIER